MKKKILSLLAILAVSPFFTALAAEEKNVPEAASEAENAVPAEEKSAEISAEKRTLFLKILGCYFAAQNGLEYANLSESDKNALAEGFALGIDGKFKDFEKTIEENSDEMGEFVQNFQSELRAKAEEKQLEELKKIVAENKAKGAAFAEKCKNEDGFNALESGVLIKVKTRGNEEFKPNPESFITVRYTGKLVDGTIFDSSEIDENGAPVDFTENSEPIAFPMPLNNLIPGWIEALQTLGKGAKATLVIPSELAYGDEPSSRLPAGSTLVFDIELVDFAEKSAEEDGEISDEILEKDED